jgi:hypothetical protein
MKWFEFFLKKKINNVHSFPFESFKSFEQKKSWILSFNNISMTIFLKKKGLINGFYYYYNNTTYVKVLSIILWIFFINLNYFTLHYLRLL